MVDRLSLGVINQFSFQPQKGVIIWTQQSHNHFAGSALGRWRWILVEEAGPVGAQVIFGMV
jgi:hypothetical protein